MTRRAGEDRGGQIAFESLFDRQFERCVSLAQRIVHDREASREVAADAFARAWARWPLLMRSDHADGWVLRVTVNRAIDVARRRAAPATHQPVNLGAEDATVLRLALVQALRELPKRQREAIALRYLSGLSEAQVSAALGVSAGTVKTHLHRGLERLRATWPADDDLEVRLEHGS